MLSRQGLAAGRIVFKAKVIVIVARGKCKLQTLKKKKRNPNTQNDKYTQIALKAKIIV